MAHQDENDLIVDGTTGDLTQAEREYAMKISRLFGDHYVQTKFLPNHAMTGDMPTGFAMKFKKGAPMLTEIMHPKMLNHGTAMFRVKNVQKNSYFYIDPARDRSGVATKAIGDAASRPLSLQIRDPETNQDMQETTYMPTLAIGTSAYGGLYRRLGRSGNRMVEDYFLVVNAGAETCGWDLMNFVETHQREVNSPVYDETLRTNIMNEPRQMETTLTMEHFLQLPETLYTINAGRRNRARVAYEFAKAMDLEVMSIEDHSAGTPGTRLAVPEIDMLSYSLEKTGSDFTLFAGAYNTQNIRHGMVFGQAPAIGPLFMCGAPNIASNAGVGWCTNDGFNAFPAGTGRVRHITESMQHAVRDDHFFWHGKNPNNHKLDADAFRVRDHKFIKQEENLGRESSWEVMTMEPIVVMIAPTD